MPKAAPTKRRVKKKPRERVEKDGRWYTKSRGVELTRCNNTKTEAEFFSFILSHCRSLLRKWSPKTAKKQEGKRAYKGPDKRTKFEYHCEGCDKWFKDKEIQMDHITPCGGMNGFDKIAGWFERALCEKDGFQRLCLTCHARKTSEERKGE